MDEKHNGEQRAWQSICGCINIEVEALELALLEVRVGDGIVGQAKELLFVSLSDRLGANGAARGKKGASTCQQGDAPVASRVRHRRVGDGELRLAKARRDGRILDAEELVRDRIFSGDGVYDASEGRVQLFVQDHGL